MENVTVSKRSIENVNIRLRIRNGDTKTNGKFGEFQKNYIKENGKFSNIIMKLMNKVYFAGQKNSLTLI